MKKIIIILALVLVSTFSFAGSFISELENSIKRAQKGSKVEYILHLKNGDTKIFTAADFHSGNLVSYKDQPLYFELFKGVGSKKHNIMINLATPVYYKLDIEKTDGVWDYVFNFYY